MTTKLYKQNKITQKTLHEWNNVKKKKKISNEARRKRIRVDKGFRSLKAL